MPRNLKLLRNTPPSVALKLAEPQLIILDLWAESGLTLSKVADTILSVMENEEDQASRVAAARLFLETTVGKAPATTNSRSVHVNLKSDKFFDEALFSRTPPPDVSANDEQTRNPLSKAH